MQINNLNEEIREVLTTEPSEVNLETAALLLLKVNRNRVLYHNVLRRKNIDKVLCELRRIYKSRTGEDAIATVKTEDNTPPPPPATPPENENKGKRADHEQLPDEIKARYIENLNLLRRMRQLHEKLKLMEGSTDEERKPFIEELLQLDKAHRENWDVYDSYKLGDEIKEKVEADPKAISAARKYLSTNKKKLAELEDEVKGVWLERMQERYDYLISVNEVISDEQKEEFKQLGLNV